MVFRDMNFGIGMWNDGMWTLEYELVELGYTLGNRSMARYHGKIMMASNGILGAMKL